MSRRPRESAEAIRDEYSQKMIKPNTITSQVYEKILGMIVSGALRPGLSLREGELAASLGVSRTPVREALHRLEEYGMVAIRANHGAVVRRLGREELISIHQIREALEGLACELACGRLTPADFSKLDDLASAARVPHAANHLEAFDRFDAELHALIAERSGNPLLAREVVKLQRVSMLVHDQLESSLIGSRKLSTAGRVEARGLFWRQHVAIVDALRAGDPAAARRAMVEHLRASCEYRTRLVGGPEQSPQSHRAGG
jgi:DNA-binding GntR family transcriptional regulator